MGRAMIKVRQEFLDRTSHQLQSRPEPAMESLVERLTSTQADVREEARRNLIARGRDAIKPLVALLPSPDAQTRWEAAKALGEIHHPDASAALASCLADEHRDVRWVAAEGLVAIGRVALEPVLEELITHADSVWVRTGAEHILRAQAGDYPCVQPVLKALTGRAPLFEVPVTAFEALKELRNLKVTSSKQSPHR